MSLSEQEKENNKLSIRKEKYDNTHKIIDGTIYKKCNQHSTYFPNEDEWLPMNEEYYYKNSSNGIDGFHPYCKECTKSKYKIWISDNPEQYKVNYERYNKNPPPQTLVRNRLNAKRQREIGYQKEYRQNNKDKLKIYNLKRANKNHNITNEEWDNCKKYFNNCCAYCGISETEAKELYNQQLHKEHVIHDGESDLSNCIPACKSCNSQKWEYEMEEWYRKTNYFNQERLDEIYKWLNEDYKQYIKEPKPKGKYIRKNNNQNIINN